MSKTVKIIILSSILFIAFLAFIVIYSFEVNAPLDSSGKPKSFTVTKGETAKLISNRLYDNGLIRSKYFFELFVWLNREENSLKVGDYQLSAAQSIKGIVSSLGEGKISEKRVLITEGETEEEMAKIFENNGLFKASDFLSLTGSPAIDYRAISDKDKPSPKDYSTEFSFLADKPKYYSLEGYLFPDTYNFSRNGTPEEAIKKMLSNFDRKLTTEMREEISKQGKTVNQIITMASLLEKEVRTVEDMKIAAGIFWNRIAIGQPLQSDATLSYVLKDKNAAHSSADLALDSPFNTYKYKGLPPTPICNPGLTAITAAIYPTKTNFNYFLTTPDGKTIFSRTFDEHKRNKVKYLK